VWIASNLATASLAQGLPSPEEFLRDAELSDVCFLDPDRGWAVGDRGVILHTKDGGRNWHLQASPVNCRLESVCFLDDRSGWIVGGWTGGRRGDQRRRAELVFDSVRRDSQLAECRLF
jgi:hypothetical protein